MQRVVSKNLKRGLAAVAAAALMAGCGGGTSQIEPFAPTRAIAFGDESGVILQSGKKYTVNGVNADTKQVDCKQAPLWSQVLVTTGFGFVFPQCNTDFVALPQGIMYATPGAKVADVRDKIDQHLSNDRFGPKDIVGIMVGVNDIVELYRQFPAQSRDSLINEAKARGKLLADQVNRIANANGRVIVSTIFDVGVSPFGQKEKQQQTDIDRAIFLNDLSSAFNTALRLNMLNDGRLVALVLTDEYIQQRVRFPALGGFSNVTDAACRTDVAPQDCTADTLVPDASVTQWMWAGDLLMGQTAQLDTGRAFLSRAKNNPF